MTVLPASFAEVRYRLAAVLGGGATGAADADEWLREACAAATGSSDPSDLPPVTRSVVLQKVSGALLALEELGGDLAFMVGQRATVARVFARYFRGVLLDGPPWRIDPTEDGRPTYAAWVASADFDADPSRVA